MAIRFSVRRELLACAVLAAAVFAVYWQVHRFGFVFFDDNHYVTENAAIQNGLNAQSLLWAFTNEHAGTWIPLTWLSLMLDYRLYGLYPGGYHLTNLLLHTANTLLLFLFLTRSTGALWRSAFVAALFALHPLHVEPVAWITARKDVLSTFFWMLTMTAYVSYAKHPGPRYYLAFAGLFILGLMAKPMLVTLPFVLLLLDYWPLGRLGYRGACSRRMTLRVIAEKIPLIFFSAAVCVVILRMNPVPAVGQPPLEMRIINAFTAYATYVIKTFWPAHLAVFYPYPGYGLPAWKAGGSLVLCAFLCVAAVWSFRRRPYLFVGLCWFTGTLVPVIGLVQTGAHAMADRFTYVPLIGLFIAIAWGGAELLRLWRVRRSIIALCYAAVVCSAALCASVQLRHWQSHRHIFTHTIAVTSRNALAHAALGLELGRQGQVDAGIAHLRRALQISPDYALAHINLGGLLVEKGLLAEAMVHLKEGIRLQPDCADAYYTLGIAYEKRANDEQALAYYRRALETDRSFYMACNNIGVVKARHGDFSGAAESFSRAIERNPRYAVAYLNRARALLKTGRHDAALADFRRVLALVPRNPRILQNIRDMLKEAGRPDMADRFLSQNSTEKHPVK